MTKKKDKNGMRLKSIANGTAIDHIPAGQALRLLEALNIKSDKPIGVVMNVDSRKTGKKDLIYVEGLELTKKDFAIIGLIAQKATINIIRRHNVVEKIKARLPSSAIGFIKCINPNCITNNESITTKFKIKDNPIEAKCLYCERWMNKEDIVRQIKS
jgi:aspartate carbamoyltransferase regulatory subunit